jgi:hypothetical protein
MVPGREKHFIQAYTLLQIARNKLARVQRRRKKPLLFSRQQVFECRRALSPIPLAAISGHPAAPEKAIACAADLPGEAFLVPVHLIAVGRPARLRKG